MTNEEKDKIKTDLEAMNKRAKINFIVCLILAILFGILIFTLSSDLFFSIFIAIFIAVIFNVALSISIKKKYKDEIVPKILKKFLGDDIVYEPKGRFDKELLRDLNFFPCTTYSGEDMISGIYKGIKFTTADISMTHQSGGKNSTTVTDFKGCMWVFEYNNKTINSRIDLYEKDYLKRHSLRKNGLEKVEFEDIDFNNKIKTYASNAHDAFYVITPQIIDRLKNNINNISGDILYSIQENKLYLVISSSKNRMEFKRFRNNYEELIESLKEDVSPILETIKLFDLKGEEKEEIWKIENLNL